MQNKPYGFVLGTLVHVPEGTCPIETIRPGDLVLSSATGPDTKVTPKRVLDVQSFPSVRIWSLFVQSLRVEKSGAEEGYVLLSPYQPLGVMGQRDFDSKYNSWAEINVIPMPEYLGYPLDGWFQASGLYDSAGIVLCTFDNVGVDAFYSHSLSTMQNPDWAWGSPFEGSDDGDVYDLSGNRPLRIHSNAENDLDLDTISDEDRVDGELYPYFRRTVYALRVEGENSYFVGKLGFLAQGLVET